VQDTDALNRDLAIDGSKPKVSTVEPPISTQRERVAAQQRFFDASCTLQDPAAVRWRSQLHREGRRGGVDLAAVRRGQSREIFFSFSFSFWPVTSHRSALGFFYSAAANMRSPNRTCISPAQVPQQRCINPLRKKKKKR